MSVIVFVYGCSVINLILVFGVTEHYYEIALRQVLEFILTLIISLYRLDGVTENVKSRLSVVVVINFVECCRNARDRIFDLFLFGVCKLIIVIVTIQNDKNFVYLHKRNFEISNNRLANEKIRDLTNAMLSRGTKNAS